MPLDIDKSFYSTGTATVAANGVAVTGQGTVWLQAVRPGDLFGTHVGMPVRILSVNSNTSLTLAYPWKGAAQTAAAYEIQSTPYDVGYQATVRTLLTTLASGNVDALAGLAGVANSLPYFTGGATMDIAPLTAFARVLLGGANQAAMLATLGAGRAPAQYSTDTSDWNTIVSPGWHDRLLGGSNANAPRVSHFYHCLVVRYSSDQNLAQIAVPYRTGTGGVHFRIRQSGSWGPWSSMEVQSGSNANGHYLRFGDGVQICSVSMSVTDQAINNAYDSLFQGTRVWTFPAAFSSLPSVSCSNFKWGNSASWGAVAGVTISYAYLRGLDTASRAAGPSVDISAIAMGRWF